MKRPYEDEENNIINSRKPKPGRSRNKSLYEDEESNIINSAIDKVLFRNSIAKTVEMSNEEMLSSIQREPPRADSPRSQSPPTPHMGDQATNQSLNKIGASSSKTQIVNLSLNITSKTKGGNRKNMEDLPRKIVKRSQVDRKAEKGLGMSNRKSGGKLARKNSSVNKSIRKQNREEKLRKKYGDKSGNIQLEDNQESGQEFKKSPKVLKKEFLSPRKNVKKTKNLIKKKVAPFIKMEKERVKQEPTKSNATSVQILADKRKSMKEIPVSSEGWQRCGVKMCDKFRYVEDKKHKDWVCSRHKEAEGTLQAVFRVGTVVTASFKAGQAPWAGIVDFCPDTEMWAWPKSDKIEVALDDEGYLGWFHVTFFTSPVTRAWVPAPRVNLYSPGQDKSIKREGNLKKKIKMMTNNNEENSAVATRSKVMEASKKGKGSKSRKMQMTQEMAEKAMNMDRKDRLKKFSFINNYKGSWKMSQK